MLAHRIATPRDPDTQTSANAHTFSCLSGATRTRPDGSTFLFLGGCGCANSCPLCRQITSELRTAGVWA